MIKNLEGIFFIFIFAVEKICDVYEKAVSKDPWNEELNTHLFMAYVRVGDYKKQQQVALNLYKIKQKNPYYFWGVMSIIMQVSAICGEFYVTSINLIPSSLRASLNQVLGIFNYCKIQILKLC